MTQLLILRLWFLLVLIAVPARGETEEEATLTKVGQVAPSFSVQTVDGKEFNLAGHKGKVVVVNFFATWCGPCLAELPHVEKEIWQKQKDEGLVLIAIGREHGNAELKSFKQKERLSFPVAGDPTREVFRKYATAYIPRTYVIDREGKIVFQSVGFQESEFTKLQQAVAKELRK